MTAKQEFDEYARRYEALHNDNLSVVGADSQEFLAAKLAFCERFIRTHVRFIPGGKLFLDYGCGTGRLGHLFMIALTRTGATWALIRQRSPLRRLKRPMPGDSAATTASRHGNLDQRRMISLSSPACCIMFLPETDRRFFVQFGTG